MGPFLAQDPRKLRLGTARTVGSLLRIADREAHRSRQQSPGLNRVGQGAFEPQVLVLRFPPDAERALKIARVSRDPHPVGHRVAAILLRETLASSRGLGASAALSAEP